MLKQFIADLQSGKLHREFHQGPDQTPPPVTAKVETATEGEVSAVPRTGTGNLPYHV